jgi:PAS domain S-box-containing protein
MYQENDMSGVNVGSPVAFLSAPLPPNEAQRLQALRSFEVLDTPADPLLDDLTQLASQICQTPMAMVSLVDGQRQWFKSRVGLAATETPRDVAFCAHAILQPDEVFLVSDALQDARFSQNPLVQDDPHVRFYAGMPLVSSEKLPLGTLCVIDQVPRQLTALQLETLQTLGKHAMAVLELRRAQKKKSLLQAQNRRLSLALEQSPVQVLMTDAEGHIIFVNHTFEQTSGYSKEEVMGQLPQVMQQHAIDNPSHHDIWQTLRQGRPWQEEMSFTTKSGQKIWDFVSIFPVIDEQSLDKHYVVFKNGITERRQIRERLKVKNEELKGFAYTVSHDLKAPLRGISGYAQELVRKHQEGMSERGQFCVAQIISASKNLDQLIEDLLKYSRLDAETPVATPVQLDVLVQSILRDRSHTLTELGVLVQLDVPAQTLTVWERGLHQVLTNLIDNAIKYSRQATPPRLTIRSQCDANQCHISVVDNGIGFDMKYHDRIFGLFNRLVRPAEFEGTGAGLAIVKKLVEKLGGSIRAESCPGQGATFYLDLPTQPNPGTRL